MILLLCNGLKFFRFVYTGIIRMFEIQILHLVVNFQRTRNQEQHSGKTFEELYSSAVRNNVI